MLILCFVCFLLPKKEFFHLCIWLLLCGNLVFLDLECGHREKEQLELDINWLNECHSKWFFLSPCFSVLQKIFEKLYVKFMYIILKRKMEKKS